MPCTSQQAAAGDDRDGPPLAVGNENAERLGAAVADRDGSVAPAARDDAQRRFGAGDAVGFIGDQIVAWAPPEQTLAPTMTELAEGLRAHRRDLR